MHGLINQIGHLSPVCTNRTKIGSKLQKLSQKTNIVGTSGHVLSGCVSECNVKQRGFE